MQKGVASRNVVKRWTLQAEDAFKTSAFVWHPIPIHANIDLDLTLTPGPITWQSPQKETQIFVVTKVYYIIEHCHFPHRRAAFPCRVHWRVSIPSRTLPFWTQRWWMAAMIHFLRSQESAARSISRKSLQLSFQEWFEMIYASTSVTSSDSPFLSQLLIWIYIEYIVLWPYRWNNTFLMTVPSFVSNLST